MSRKTNLFIIWVTKLISFLSSRLGLGHGSTWPGHIALKLNKNFLNQTINNKNLTIIFIAGTNGKTTTTKLLKTILQKEGKKVIHNTSGANLINGLASVAIKESSLFGKLNAEVALFEIDENTLPIATKEIHPDAIVLLNLFRDQLDRYGEVNTIAKKWQDALSRIPKKTKLIINGDDPQLTFLAQQSGLKTEYFGFPDELMEAKKTGHDVDFLFCPKCNTRLEFKKSSFSHMGDFLCHNCGFTHPKTTSANIKSSLMGKYNIYNTSAASLVAKSVFSTSDEIIAKSLAEFKPAFGRQEKIEVEGKSVILLLSKNPTGFNQSIQAILDEQKPYSALIILNDRIPDGRDVSWIWDVDFENLKNAKNITVSGDRTYDMALRMKYAEADFVTKENTGQAIQSALKTTGSNETLFILPTYSAMLEVRQILKGRKIL